MNRGIVRIHRVFFAIYGGLSALLLLAELGQFSRSDPDWGIGGLAFVFLPIALLHWSAAQGASKGIRRGKVLSSGVAFLFLVAFPVGTLIGIFMFTRLGKRWQQAPEPVPTRATA